MLTDQQKRIVANLWNDIEMSEGLSTEALFARTCHAATDQLGVTVDESDVCDALLKYGGATIEVSP